MNLSSRITGFLLCLICCNTPSLFAQPPAAEREFLFSKKIYEDGLFSLAANEFRTFSERFPNDSLADDALFFAGDSYFKIAEYGQAFELLKTLELGYPQSALLPKAGMLMAESQLALGRYAAAAKLFQRVTYFYPDSEFAAQALLRSAESYRQAGHFAKALAGNLKVLSNYPTSPERMEAHLQIIGLYADRADYSEAIAQSDRALAEVGPGLKDARVYQLRAEIFGKTGQLDEAESLYERIIIEFPDSDSAQMAPFQLARLRQRHGDLSGALEHLNKFLAGSKDSRTTAEALVVRGRILQQLDRDEEAEASLKQVAETGLDELSARMRLRLGVGLVKSGDYSRAGSVLQELVERDSTQLNDTGEPPQEISDAYTVLAHIFLSLGDTDKMLRLTRLHESRYPGSDHLAPLMMLKGKLYETVLHNYSAALRVYQNLIEDFPNQDEVDDAQFQIARCYERLDDYRLALREYRNYLDRYPGGDFFEKVREQIKLIEETTPLASDNGLREMTSLYLTLRKPAQHPKFAIAKTTFNLKSFQTAVGQFKELLKDENPTVSRNTVFFYLGKSYFRLGQKAALLGKADLSQALYDSAGISLQFVAENASDVAAREEADYLLIKLALADTSTSHLSTILNAAYEKWTQQYSAGGHKHEVLLQVASHDLALASQDTTALRRALGIYEGILTNESPKPAGEFYYGLLRCLQLSNQDSILVSKASEFIGTAAKDDYLPRVLLLRASAYEAIGDTVAALKDLGRIRSEFFYARQAKQALFQMGELHLHLGEDQAAVNSFSKLLKSYARNQPDEALSTLGLTALRERATAYARLGMSDAALRDYVTFIVTAPDDNPDVTQVMLSVARIATRQHNDTFAREYYENVLKENPPARERFGAQASIGDIYFEKKLFADAISNYKLALAVAPTQADSRYAESKIIRATFKSKLIQAGEALVATFRKNYKNTNDDLARFLLDKADAYRANKSFDAAKRTYEKVKNDFGHSEFGAQGEFGLGAVELVTNHTEHALKILTAIPSRYPDSKVTPLAYYNLGDFYYKSNQLQNAIHAFKRTIEHPKSGEFHAKALIYLAKCYKDARMWDQAIALTRQYLDTYPNADDSFTRKVDLGQFLMNLKEYDRAIAHFRKILPYADVESEAAIQFYIAQSYKEMGSFEKATTEFLKVKYLTPRTKLPWHVTAMFETGKCLVSLKRFEQAKQIFQRIVAEQGAGSNFGKFALRQLEGLGNVDSTNAARE